MPSPEASRRNLGNARNSGRIKLRRLLSETGIIKLLIWQAYFSDDPRPSQRALARQLRVSQPYVCKVMREAHPVGWDALARGEHATFEELEQARRVTARVREREPDLFTPAPHRSASDEPRVLTADERIAETQREVAAWKRKNPSDGRLRTWQESEELRRRGGRRVLFRVPVR